MLGSAGHDFPSPRASHCPCTTAATYHGRKAEQRNWRVPCTTASGLSFRNAQKGGIASMKVIAVVTLFAVASLASAKAFQTIRPGSVISSVNPGDVLVLRELSRSTGQPTGTMPAGHANLLRRTLKNLADLAIAEPAGASAGVTLDQKFRVDRPLLISEVTVDVPRLLGLQVSVGRLFEAGDRHSGRTAGVLVNTAWKTLLAGRPDVVGSVAVHVHPGADREVVIVGVLQPSALASVPEIDSHTELLVLSGHDVDPPSPSDRWPSPIVKPHTGVTLVQLQRALDETASRINASETGSDVAYRLESMRRKERHSFW